MGLVYRERGEYMKALVEAEKAIAIDSNYANAHVLLATLLYYAGRPKEGMERIKKAMKINPHHPYNYPYHLGQAYFILGEYQEAIVALEQGLATNPSSERMRVWLAAAYALDGRKEDAKWGPNRCLPLIPIFPCSASGRHFHSRIQQILNVFWSACVSQGLHNKYLVGRISLFSIYWDLHSLFSSGCAL